MYLRERKLCLPSLESISKDELIIPPSGQLSWDHCHFEEKTEEERITSFVACDILIVGVETWPQIRVDTMLFMQSCDPDRVMHERNALEQIEQNFRQTSYFILHVGTVYKPKALKKIVSDFHVSLSLSPAMYLSSKDLKSANKYDCWWGHSLQGQYVEQSMNKREI